MDDGFFDGIYESAGRDEQAVPWQHAISRPLVAEWLAQLDPAAHRRALVVAAGLGDDAAALAARGLDVVAFDLAPSAVDWARARHSTAAVDWRVADVLDPPSEWRGAFDLVVEVFTVQSIPPTDAGRAADAIRSFVAPGGTLVVVALVRDDDDEPDGPPWPLHRSTFDRLGDGLVEVATREIDSGPRTRCVCAELRRPLP